MGLLEKGTIAPRHFDRGTFRLGLLEKGTIAPGLLTQGFTYRDFVTFYIDQCLPTRTSNMRTDSTDLQVKCELPRRFAGSAR